MQPAVELRPLVFLLRLAGFVTLLAFPAMLLPTAWMDATHRWLGLGELPRAPVVEYLTRSVAALYGFHGVLLLIVAGDPVRYRPLVRYVGLMNVFFGLLISAIDIHAGLPLAWTLLEGPPIVGMGAAVLYLSRSVRLPHAHRGGDGLSAGWG
jgi:hypothetical protein